LHRKVPKKKKKLPKYKVLRKIFIRGLPAVLTYSEQTKLYWVFLTNLKEGTPLAVGETDDLAVQRSIAMVPDNRPRREVSIGNIKPDSRIPKLMNAVNSQPIPQSKPEFSFVGQEVLS
jgi:hypothetical protein